jgi:hypothetical protein
MNEWFNETLVTIQTATSGRYRVVELPAKSTATHTSRRRFKSAEQAEDYIQEQYPGALVVQPEDITEEIERRKQCTLPDDDITVEAVDLAGRLISFHVPEESNQLEIAIRAEDAPSKPLIVLTFSSGAATQMIRNLGQTDFVGALDDLTPGENALYQAAMDEVRAFGSPFCISQAEIDSH